MASNPRAVTLAPVVTAGAVMAIAVTALAGWAVNSPALAGGIRGLPAMSPLSAIALATGAAGLWLSRARGTRAAAAGRAMGIALVALGLLRLSGYALGWPADLDQLLFVTRVDAFTPPARTAPATALALVLLGLGLASRDMRNVRGMPPAWFLVPPAAFIALMALVGYAYGAPAVAGSGWLRLIAVNTAGCIGLLAVGTLLLRPADPFVSVVISPSATGASLRRLLLAALVVPVTLGLLRLVGQRLGWYETEFGLALFAVSMVAVFSLIIWTNGLVLERAEQLRLRAEEAVRESEARLFQILDALPVGVFALDHRGRAYYANQMSREILGRGLVAGAEVASLPDLYRAYVAGTDQIYPGERQPITRALDGERAHAVDLEIQRPDGRVPLEIWAAPVYGGDGQVTYAIAVFSDVSEQREAARKIARLNSELTQAVAELKDLNHELEAFAYSVSHDLRAPIRHIDGFTRLLAEQLGDAASERASHYLGRVRDGARHMGLLIDDLLRLSRVARQDLSTAPADLNAVLRGVIYDLREETGTREIDWKIDKLPRIDCDAGLVKQVFANLVANAIKFTRPRERAVIEIGHQSDNGVPVLFVRDNGVGFDMRYADKLFGVFQRLHRQDDFEGTGVGLATVHRIVHKHGGRIWVEAQLDKGAAFYFTLGPPREAS